MKVELNANPTQRLLSALAAGLTEPTRSTMEPVDLARPRWSTAFFFAVVTVAWALGAWLMIAVSIQDGHAAEQYSRATVCGAPRTGPGECLGRSSSTVVEIVYRTDHYRYLWESQDQRLQLRLADGSQREARFDGTPNWVINPGQAVTAEIWQHQVTAVQSGNRTEPTAINPVHKRDQDRLTMTGLLLITLAFGAGAALLTARVARYKPLSDYKLQAG